VISEELFVFHVNKAFGKFPVELSAEHIERLAGMAACYAEPNPFGVLIRAIRNLGTIKVWRENEK
jgi:hypothetical protein